MLLPSFVADERWRVTIEEAVLAFAALSMFDRVQPDEGVQ